MDGHRRGGQKIYNLTGVYRNGLFLNGAPVQQPNAGNLAEQAAAQAAANGFNGGYIEDASFTKLREVTVSLPVYGLNSNLTRRSQFDIEQELERPITLRMTPAR